MQITVKTIAELKSIRLNEFDTFFCPTTGLEYYLVEDGGLVPNDLDVLQAIQGGNWRLKGQDARDAVIGGGGGLPVASQLEAEAGLLNDKTMTPLRVLQSITANAPGGGSAYPDNLTFINANTTLTPADQGIIFCINGVAQLPAAAPNGTTYKFIGSPNDMVIDTNGTGIVNLGSGAAIRPGVANLQIIAINAPGLLWYPVSKFDGGSYNAAYTYMTGDVVTDGGTRYMSLTDANTGNATSDPVNWTAIGGGSAYPDNIQVLTANTVLTAADQGVIVTAGSITVTLPAAAVDGVTFKIYNAAGVLTIDTNGAPIAGIGTGTVQPAKQLLTLVGANMPGLQWLPLDNDRPALYSATDVYTRGQIVDGNNGFFYLALNYSMVAEPLTNTGAWYKFAKGITQTPYTNVEPSRAIDTIYTNTDSGPRVVCVSMAFPQNNAGDYGVVNVRVDGVEIAQAFPASISAVGATIAAGTQIINFLVPAGATYEISTVAGTPGFTPYIDKWFESALRV